MSRSRKKRPFAGISTAASEKEFKRKCNRVLRQRQKAAVRNKVDPACVPLHPREVVNEFAGPKDGKRRLKLGHPLEDREMRK